MTASTPAIGMSDAAELLGRIKALRPTVRVGLTKFASQRVGRTDHDLLGEQMPRNLALAGECLGWTNRVGRDANAWVVQSWLDSPTHHKVLMDPQWRWFGVAVKKIGDQTYFALEFGR